METITDKQRIFMDHINVNRYLKELEDANVEYWVSYIDKYIIVRSEGIESNSLEVYN